MTEPVLLPELDPIENPEGLDWSRIEAEYRAGKPQRQIAREFGVSQAAISKRAKRDGWARAVITSTDNQADNQADNRKLGPEEGRAMLEMFYAGRDCARTLAEPADAHRKDDDWWRADSNREAILCYQQQSLAVYMNTVGQLVIREERYWDRDDDTVITIDPAHVPARGVGGWAFEIRPMRPAPPRRAIGHGLVIRCSAVSHC